MSIKDLFGKKRQYLSQTTNQELFDNVESSKNVSQKIQLKSTYIPQVDYSEPANFAKYGSAFLYYRSAMERIYDFYPYDGSDGEINEFLNNSMPHERYIFDNLYPRTNGYANFDGASYIDLKGGPNGVSSYSTLSNLFKSEGSHKRVQANSYETDIYQGDDKPSNYGAGSRESNLKCDFTTGVTVEFWLKAPTPSSDTKQTIFHLTNSSGGDALTIFLSGTAGSPFHVSLDNSSTSVFANQQIGSTPTTSSISSWSHYALSFTSASSGVTTKMYVNGRLNDTQTFGSTGVDSFEQNATIAYIASGSAGYLSGSIDEFRFWKTERDAYQIGTNYFTQVRGGANSDTSNASLGVYYKFNEGTTGDSTLDRVVLDYAGRITNGNWNGTVSRTLQSAMVESGVSETEYLDPIIYSEHPDVISLKSDLEEKGTAHDSNSTTKFTNYIPSWILEEAESQDTELELVSHIIGSYFDKLFLQIQSVETFKQPLYTSSSYKPLTFARHLPQSLGLYTPEIFIDSSIVNTVANKTDDFNFQSDLEDTKNLIYLNLYNNLASIFKSKGTEKSIKGILRCFYIDDQIVRLNTYSNKARYELRNNLEQTTKVNNFANFNTANNIDAVVYQRQNPSDTTNTIGYISGSEASGYEFAYGATVEADITFPYFNTENDIIDRRFTDISLFGLVSASVDSPNDTTFFGTDNSNFQVFAVRDAPKSKNVYFKLTSSISPNPFPLMTSSIFFDVYNNQDWNFSVSVVPSKSGSLKFVTGSDDYAYTLRFEGYNSLLGDVRDSFVLEEAITKTAGENFLKSAKRVYAGAYRNNLTGTLDTKSDVLVSGIRYWLKNIDYGSKKQHTLDFDNVGVTDTATNISVLDPDTKDLDVLNRNTLALSWEFGDVTGSDSSGNFYVTDFSSGSAQTRDSYGWVGSIAGYQHSGYGFGFAASSTTPIKTDRINIFKFVDPERAISSDMINLVDDRELVYGAPEDVVSYHHALEKSMYSAVSDEMLKFFAGAADFNSLIGEPVNRYRMNYKALEKLRQAFYLRVENVKEVEKYIEYYKWFDDSLGDIIKQMIPASSEVSENIFDVVESHVLERNKYQSKFPTIDFKPADRESPALGINEKALDWQRNHHPASNLQTENSEYWRTRAERRGSDVISSGDNLIDSQRDIFIDRADKYGNQPAPTLTEVDGTTYSGQTYVLRHRQRPYRFSVDRRTNPPRIFKGGVNFEVNKRFGYHRGALYPGGPVNQDDNVYVPTNVLFGLTSEIVEQENTTDPPKNPNELVRRNIKIQSGRDWEDGVGYMNMKSDIVLPFNIVSSSVTTGYSKQVVERVTASVDIVNVHNDVYGKDMERPMQGPFTDYAVGGLQYRHIKLNTGNDNYLNRPEGWKILLGLCNGVSGAVGMVGPDYPYPEANEVGENPYPMTGAQKAFFYRDHVAKRPVNIRNIHHTTGSTILGNYNHNYDVVQVGSAYSNPRQFVENQPNLPSNTFNSITNKATSVRTILQLNRSERGHFEFNGEYSTDYLQSGSGESVIITRFSAPGGIEVMTKGYQDFRSSEFSVYNAMNARNLTVRRPYQGVSSSIVSETEGIRTYDIHGQDFGLMNLSARHAGKFFRDSTLVADPGSADDAFTESPAFHRSHRNSKAYEGTVKYDNAFVQHQIPQSDRQYSWITSSIVNTDSTDPRYSGFMAVNSILGPYYEITGTYIPFFDYVTASQTYSDIYQNTTRLNLLVTDPTDAATNTLGTDSIQNTDVGGTIPAKRLNALLIRRGDNYGWGSWRSVRNMDHPILLNERRSNLFSAVLSPLTSYSLKPFTYQGRPLTVNLYKNVSGSTVTTNLKVSYNNFKVGFDDRLLQDRIGYDTSGRKTGFDALLSMVKKNRDYRLNWVLYSENIFPSEINAYDDDKTYRNTYNNFYWRDSRDDRATLGNSFDNTFRVDVSQSSWPLDEPEDFLTRAAPPLANVNKTVNAGELQNTYFHYFYNTTPIPPNNLVRTLTPAGMYARKHLMTTYRSVVTPSGIQIPETGSGHTSLTGSPIQVYGGEAAWQAGEQAGYYDYSSGTTFVSSASEPWFDQYSDFKAELKPISKDYAIVPEFRISEKVPLYLKNGINAAGLVSTFEIPGTPHDSGDTGFYKDYSNSDFLKEFSDISEKSNTTPSEIRLVCKAITRFNPYKGFYPVQRTQDIVEEFGNTYGRRSLTGEGYGLSPTSGRQAINFSGSLLRPVIQPLFSPGILYNTIKSGIAVDYPVITSPKKTVFNPVDDIWVLNPAVGALDPNNKELYNGGEYWDKRIPFEAIMDPDRYMLNLPIHDIESHPSASLNATASIAYPASSPSYGKMAGNFFAGVADFFLKDSEFSSLKSNTFEGSVKFASGSSYGARLKLKRSTAGNRTYEFDYDAQGVTGNNATSHFGLYGLRVSSSSGLGSGSIPVPQDPKENTGFRETFTMYSRPTAFGPPIWGRPTGSVSENSGALDSLTGYNWAFTPPYYHGESWADLVFYPDHTKTYTLEEILSEIKVKYWRVDPGSSTTRLMPEETYTIYSAENANDNAMQIDSCVNLFGVEDIPFQETNVSTGQISTRNSSVSQRWVIQLKAETPMMNFNDVSASIPTFASESVPRGMWHQFGTLPSDPDDGVFMEIGDIPADWLKFHYSVINDDTVYNNNNASGLGANVFRNMKSLTDLVGFENTSVRLGELKDSQTVREAIVAVPYVLDSGCEDDPQSLTSLQKQFFTIPRERVKAALDVGTIAGDSKDSAGDSIRDLIANVKQYVLPPEFDFLSDPKKQALVMYFFEFEQEFDKDDLAYIWQNLAPRNYKKMRKRTQFSAHTLAKNELLSPEDILDNNNLRWMVFKVKERKMSKYQDKIYRRAGSKSTKTEETGYSIEYNWPQDYLSFIEMIKMDTEVLMKNENNINSTKKNIDKNKDPDQESSGEVLTVGVTGNNL